MASEGGMEALGRWGREREGVRMSGGGVGEG